MGTHSGLPSFDFSGTLNLLKAVATVGVFLWLILLPAILISYEHWKQKVR